MMVGGELREILIVEDSATQAEQVRYSLEKHGFAVRTAANGVEALSLMQQKPPDIIVSDVVMPEMDGYEFCRRVKEDETYKQIPVILLTSLSDPRDVLRGLECGADNFIVKPYDERYLLSRLQYLIANAHLRQVDTAQLGIEIVLAGEKHFIKSDRISILNLLLSSYEIAIMRNSELVRVRDEMLLLNESLEEKVAERTFAIREELKKRKEVEEALKESEERHRVIMETANDAIICIAPPGTVYLWNKKAEEIFCYTSGEALGKSVPDLIIPDRYHAGEQEAIALLLRDGSGPRVGKSTELTLRQKSGEEFPAELSLAALQIRGEWHAIGIVRDITARKKAEQELQKVKNYLSDIIDSMPSVLIGFCANEVVTQWNREAARITGIPASEAIGRQVGALIPEFYSWIETLRSQARTRRSAALEKLLLTRGGERSFYDLILYRLSSDSEQGAVVRIEDVTERTHIQEMMVQTEKMMSIGGLAAGMAHEINNPLGIISQAAQNIERRLFADLPANLQAASDLGVDLAALRRYLEQRQVPQFVDSIRQAASRAAKIVTNMLQFSRQAPMAKQPAPLERLIEQAVEFAANDYDLKKKYDFRAVEIVKEYQPDMPEVPVVAVEIEQVILNLVRNAAQAMSANTPERRPRITFRLRTEGKYAVLEVEDCGPGMDEKVMRRVFEPFFTTKEPGVGTGLGLSVSYMIVTANHKGLLEVASAPGTGACFTIRLPLTEEAQDVRK